MKNNSHMFIRIAVYFYVTALFALGAKAQSPYLQCPPAYTCLPNITLAGGVTGSGNVGTIPVFNTTSSLSSSTFTVSGNTITNSGGIDFVTTGGNDITINASGLFTVNATQLNTSNISVGSGAIDLTTSGNGTFTGTVNTASLTIPSGASSGYVLTSDESGNGTWQTSYLVSTTTLTATDIKAMKNSRITIIPAPASGKSIVVDYVVLQRIFNTTAFASGSIVNIAPTGATGNSQQDAQIVIPTAVFQYTASKNSVHWVQPTTVAGTQNIASATAMQIFSSTTDFTTGDGTVVVRAYYHLIDF